MASIPLRLFVIEGPGFRATKPYVDKILKEKRCVWCGRIFTPLNSKAKYCKTSHRVAAYKKAKRHQKSEEIKRVLQQEREKLAASAETIVDRELQQELEENSKEFKELFINGP